MDQMEIFLKDTLEMEKKGIDFHFGKNITFLLDSDESLNHSQLNSLQADNEDIFCFGFTFIFIRISYGYCFIINNCY